MKCLFSQMFQKYNVLDKTWKAVFFTSIDEYIHKLFFQLSFFFPPTKEKDVQWIVICRHTPLILKQGDFVLRNSKDFFFFN